MFFSYIVRKFYSKDRTRDSKVTKTGTEELPETHVSEDEFSDSDVDFSSNDVGGSAEEADSSVDVESETEEELMTSDEDVDDDDAQHSKATKKRRTISISNGTKKTINGSPQQDLKILRSVT